MPVVFEHSPYRGNTGNPANHGVDFEHLPQERRASASARRRGDGPLDPHRPQGPSRAARDLPGSLDNYFVPRGYAVVLGESVGTSAPPTTAR